MQKIRLLSLFLFFFTIHAGFSFPFFYPQIQSNFFSSNQILDCLTYQRVGDEIFLEPSCILQGKLPKFSLKDRADMIGSRIASVDNGYDSQSEAILYKPVEITLNKRTNLYPITEKRRKNLLLAQKKGEKIGFPLSFFAPFVVSDLAFYVSDKDISQLKPCTKHNYLLAFGTLDGKVIKAGSDFNFNRHLFGLR